MRGMRIEGQKFRSENLFMNFMMKSSYLAFKDHFLIKILIYKNQTLEIKSINPYASHV